jgi:hypothetical protein
VCVCVRVNVGEWLEGRAMLGLVGGLIGRSIDRGILGIGHAIDPSINSPK